MAWSQFPSSFNVAGPPVATLIIFPQPRTICEARLRSILRNALIWTLYLPLYQHIWPNLLLFWQCPWWVATRIWVRPKHSWLLFWVSCHNPCPVIHPHTIHLSLLGSFQIWCPHWRGEGGHGEADIVREVAWNIVYKSHPNADKRGWNQKFQKIWGHHIWKLTCINFTHDDYDENDYNE